METLLLLAHTESDGTLAKPVFEVLGGARKLLEAMPGSSLLIGLSGGNLRAAADQLANSGAQRLLGVDGADFDQARYASDAAAAEALCRAAQATLVLAPATSRWCRVLPGVAHRLQGKVDTHVTGITIEGPGFSIHRWYYRQRMEAVLQRPQRPWILLLDAGCHEPWSGEAGKAALEAVPVELPDCCRRTQVQGLKAPPADQQTIRPEARLLFVAGAGWTKKQADGQCHGQEAEKLIREFLLRTRASLGSSKSLVDLSGEGQAVLPFLTHLNQVGQTGATPRHAKGLSTCCHGEEPHTVGWRFINERRAINLDPNCGWARGKADVLYVADAFAVLAQLNSRLAVKSQAGPH